MQAEYVEIDRGKARELYRAYKKHLHWSQPIDDEIRRAYQMLAQGKLVVKALESIKAAGLKTEGEDAGFPKLALCRADAKNCTVLMHADGSADMCADRTSAWGRKASKNVFHFAGDTFPRIKRDRSYRATAVVPLPPINQRPQRGLANYHTLWEAEWTRIAPYDPMLLRRLGKADLWVVVAMWDLTEIERAALSTRITV